LEVVLLIGFQCWLEIKITVRQVLMSFNFWHKQIARFFWQEKLS